MKRPLAALLLIAAGCQPSSETTPDAPAGTPARPFGDPYEILLSTSPAEPDMPPGLDGDTLDVQVAYSGGCADHAFALDVRVEADTAWLRLDHDAGGDTCEGYLYDPLRIAVPPAALTAPVVALRNPDGGPPFVLRRRSITP